MELHIITEANRCLNCKKPMCMEGCPIHTPIPKAISLFKEGKLMEAGQMLFENNPMSLVCSMVCNHEQQCAGHCVLGKKGNPIHFFSIETYISDMYLDRMAVNRAQPNGIKAAVIGAGPAGITAAIQLAAKGYDVTVFEWNDCIGGILRYGIPEFRLPKSILDRYQARLEDMGIHIRPNTTIGAVLMIDDLFRDGYKSVFIGTGAEKPKSLGIRGETLGNVYFGLNYLANPQGHKLGDRVAVIGMGNAAMDVARTALRQGARHVTLFARGKRITASSNEVDYARLDGAEFVFGKQIQYIEEAGPVFKTSLFDGEGHIVGLGEEEFHFPADSVILSVSQLPRKKLVRTTDGLQADDRGNLIVDQHYMTTRPGVFAAGDVTTGPKTVVHAVEAAKQAAEAMDAFMRP